MINQKGRKRGIAFQSPLWPYLEQIRSWRRARMTWREITDLLNAEPYSIGLSLQAIHSFFASASKRQKPPLGFDSLPGQTCPPAEEPTPAPPKQSTKANNLESIGDKFDRLTKDENKPRKIPFI
jgi:hypothetical protein